MRTAWIIVLGAALMIGGGITYYNYQTGLPQCYAGQNEICPPAKWMNAYDHMDEEGAHLRAGVPGGYVYNDRNRKFVKEVSPTPFPTPTTVPPAQPGR